MTKKKDSAMIQRHNRRTEMQSEKNSGKGKNFRGHFVQNGNRPKKSGKHTMGTDMIPAIQQQFDLGFKNLTLTKNRNTHACMHETSQLPAVKHTAPNC
jgi:hypothetical protein